MNYYVNRAPSAGMSVTNEVNRYDQPAVGRRLEDYYKIGRREGEPLAPRRSGYVRNYLHSNEINIENNNTIIEFIPNLWYISLGFLLWDTIRMLNWYVDEIIPEYVIHKTIDPNPDSFVSRHPKYDRYVEKYIGILNSFNDLGNKLRCENPQVQELISNCTGGNRDKTELCTDGRGNYFNNKNDIIRHASNVGILPSPLSSEEFNNIRDSNTFEDLCNLVSAYTVYKDPDILDRVREAIRRRENTDAGEEEDIMDDPDL